MAPKPCKYTKIPKIQKFSALLPAPEAYSLKNFRIFGIFGYSHGFGTLSFGFFGFFGYLPGFGGTGCMYEVPGDVSPGPCGEKTQRKKKRKKTKPKIRRGQLDNIRGNVAATKNHLSLQDCAGHSVGEYMCKSGFLMVYQSRDA